MATGNVTTLYKRGVASFPKCGRTWIRLFLYYYWKFSGLEWSDVEVMFGHGDRFEYRKRVLLIRHPCDVMVSYWLHKTVRGKTQASVSQFIRGKRNHGIADWNRRHRVWSQRTENQLVVRYENMFDTQTWLDMLGFWDIQLCEEAFTKSIEKTQFDTIRANMEEIATFPSAWRYLAAVHGRYNVIEPKDPEAHKFRRGKVGGYVDYLGEEDIAYILETFTLGERLEPYRQQYLRESEQYHA
jgi:hypothetical protein